jgi:hypothetical protein
MKILRVTCCLFVLLLSLLAFAFVAVHPAAAQGLTPPPPPGATCQTTGQGTICHATMTITYSTPNGVTCDSLQVIESATIRVSETDFYNQAGNATRIVLHIVGKNGTLSIPETGKSVFFDQHFTEILTFATPGDFSTVTRTFTGQVYKVTLPGSGLILHDVGRVIFAPDGTITFEGGPHQLLHNQVQKLCAALT